jgi:hypothetical protein
MFLQSWRFLTLLLAALALTMTSAHVLELPQKMTYDANLYAAVNGTLYRYFAVVGGGYYVGSIIAAIVLAVLVRRHPDAHRWTVLGAICLLAGFLSWLALVAPVNAQVAAAIRNAPATVPTLWMALRDRWEYGHATGFVLQLLGFSALLVSLIVKIPRHHSHRLVTKRSEIAQGDTAGRPMRLTKAGSPRTP